jgi:GPH family glycoside/pentoside/hexuronide:cation symporter
MHSIPRFLHSLSLNNKLPTWRKWFYGSGDFGFSLTSTIVAAYFAIFLTDVVGVRPGIAAIAIGIGRIWDYINDPLFGYISDHTHTRWGRRRPFLILGILPFVIAYTMMWWKPPVHVDIALVVYYAVAYVFYDAAATMIYMPYYALTPELTWDYDERTSIMSVRAFFSIVGSLVAFTIPLAMVAFSPGQEKNILIMGITFAILSAIPILLVFFGTRERPEFMQLKQPGLFEAVKAAFKNRPFIFGTIIILFTWLTIDILQTMIYYFIKHVVQRESVDFLITGTIFVSAIPFLPLWNWLSRRLNKRLAYIIGMLFFASVLMVLIMLTPTTPLAVIIILCVFAAIGVSAAHIIPWSMIPDAIEYGEHKTGNRNEGMFFSLISLTQKIASSFAIPLALLMLDRTGYIPNSPEQPASAVTGIKFLVGPIPMVLLCLGILFAILYPLGRENYTKIARELEERRSHPVEEVE